MLSDATSNKIRYQTPFPSHPDACCEKPYSSFEYLFQIEPSYPVSDVMTTKHASHRTHPAEQHHSRRIQWHILPNLSVVEPVSAPLSLQSRDPEAELSRTQDSGLRFKWYGVSLHCILNPIFTRTCIYGIVLY